MLEALELRTDKLQARRSQQDSYVLYIIFLIFHLGRLAQRDLRVPGLNSTNALGLAGLGYFGK